MHSHLQSAQLQFPLSNLSITFRFPRLFISFPRVQHGFNMASTWLQHGFNMTSTHSIAESGGGICGFCGLGIKTTTMAELQAIALCNLQNRNILTFSLEKGGKRMEKDRTQGRDPFVIRSQAFCFRRERQLLLQFYGQ